MQIILRIFISIISLLLLVWVLSGCAGGSLTTREKGGLIGAVGGATVGGLIGGAVGHPGAGAAIGGALGLGAGAVIGDQMQKNEQNQELQPPPQQEMRRQEFNPNNLLGMRENDAIRKANAAGYDVKISRRGSSRYHHGTDYRPDRIILEIDRGIVTSAYIG